MSSRRWPNHRLTAPVRLLLAAVLSTLLIPSTGMGQSTDWQRFAFTQPQMGVPFRIVLYARSIQHAERAAKAAYQRISQLNDCLSNYDTDSELSQLGYGSGKTGWTDISEDLYRVIRHAQQLSQRTDGQFDLTIGPLAASWRNARRTKSFPNQAQLARFQNRVGWTALKLDHARQRVLLTRKGMRLDPGGIAKGDALDQALRTLRQQGISSALVAGAGDIAVSEPPPGRAAWRIQLAEFNDQSAHLPSFVELANQAIATSGDLFQFVEIGGKRYSHIVDPKTGLGLTHRRLVTVIARRGITADSLATALSVAGIQEANSLLQVYPGTSARIVEKRGQSEQTSYVGPFPVRQDSANPSPALR